MAPVSFFVRKPVLGGRHPYGGVLGAGGVGKWAQKFVVGAMRTESVVAKRIRTINCVVECKRSGVGQQPDKPLTFAHLIRA